MYQLRERTKGKSEAETQRAVTGRMVTDVEMNGTARGAVELFNLSSRLRRGDVLFAECVRTFSTRHVDVRAWLHRLSMEIQKTHVAQYVMHVPASTRPHVRTERSKPAYPDMYGFRPLQWPWRLLSAFEFMMYWHCEPLVAPFVYARQGDMPRTEWTEAGDKKYKEMLIQDYKKKQGWKYESVVLRPGTHYTVLECPTKSYYTFPETPERTYSVFRHAWVLVRNKRPYVPVLEGAPLPSTARSSDENAKYFSVFFRPWTLVAGSEDVPELQHLAIPPGMLSTVYGHAQPQVRRRLRGPQPPPHSLKREEALQWGRAWDEYVRGVPLEGQARVAQIPSEHCRRLIQMLLLNTMARGAEDDGDEEEADPSDMDTEIPALKLTSGDARRLLHKSSMRIR